MKRLRGYFSIAEAACRGFAGPRLGIDEKRKAEVKYIPGITYVSERNALSICDTWLAFLMMKSSYMCKRRGGSDRTWRTADRGLAGAAAGLEREAAAAAVTGADGIVAMAAAAGLDVDEPSQGLCLRWVVEASP